VGDEMPTQPQRGRNVSAIPAVHLDLIGVPAAALPRPGALDEARAWLARELHDGAVQRLTVMAVEIERLRRRTGLAGELEQLQSTTRAALNDLRKLLYDLREEPAFDARFVESIRDLLAELAAVSEVEADLVVHSWPEELPFHLAANLRRIVGESLSNVRRHSGATRVTVTLQAVDGALAVTVADNGRGILSTEGGFGLRGMGERARQLGGRVTVESRPGHGTTVRCIVSFGGTR
jgi:signal transduction histidine kinase